MEKDGAVVKEELKLKGVRLTYEVANEITKETLSAIASQRDRRVTVPQHMIQKKMGKFSLRSLTILKQLRFTSSKRHILPDSDMLDTLPYGY